MKQGVCRKINGAKRIMASSDTQFKKGNPGGPGRPKGSVCGRKKALAVLDEILGDENNLKLLRKQLQEMVK